LIMPTIRPLITKTTSHLGHMAQFLLHPVLPSAGAIVQTHLRQFRVLKVRNPKNFYLKQQISPKNRGHYMTLKPRKLFNF
jgi:hypothetical protein